MSVEYTIAAIPTEYRGVRYRSRLEARWAAFFDRLGWAFEYEPFDLGAWSPDFLLTALDVLVEVKPLTKTSWDQETVNKLFKAAGGRWILLTTVAPELYKDVVDCGWLFDPAGICHHAMIGWLSDKDRPFMSATFPVPTPERIRKEAPDALIWAPPILSVPPGSISFYGDYTIKRWADACNAVQWEPGE